METGNEGYNELNAQQAGGRAEIRIIPCLCSNNCCKTSITKRFSNISAFSTSASTLLRVVAVCFGFSHLSATITLITAPISPDSSNPHQNKREHRTYWWVMCIHGGHYLWKLQSEKGQVCCSNHFSSEQKEHQSELHSDLSRRRQSAVKVVRVHLKYTKAVPFRKSRPAKLHQEVHRLLSWWRLLFCWLEERV